MTIIRISSKGQVVLPASVRRRLGLIEGSTLRVCEESDGVKLVVERPVSATSIAAAAGIVMARSKGRSRRLADFDPARLLRAKK